MKRLNCIYCGSKLIETTIPKYEIPGLGIPLVLVGSIRLFKCSECGKKEYDLPEINILISVAVVSRVINPKQLSASEIRFIRKTLGLAAIEFARLLGATLETVSRWENEKLTNMSTSTEKLIRLIALNRLADEDFDVRDESDCIINMDIERPRDKPVPIRQEIKLPLSAISHRKRTPSQRKRGRKISTTNKSRSVLCVAR